MSALVLASGSAARKAMLENAGLSVLVDPARVDEDGVKASSREAGLAAGEVAEALAELKAQRISARYPGAMVIGADQMLECDGVWFDKAPDIATARKQLLSLRGRHHELVSTAVVVRDGGRMWHTTDRAHLLMRDFSEDFLDAYLARNSDIATSTVGGYALEGEGVQLFSRITGDFFTILGMPILPLMDFLRANGVIVR